MSSATPIIPVLDLMIGQIVLAQGGKRDDYLPVNSKLTRSSQPMDVAKAIFHQTGCSTFYLADIDSFAGAEPNWKVYRQLLDTDFGLWIDANWLKENRTETLLNHLEHREKLKLIISSETIQSFDQIDQIAKLREQGIEPIFSLDQSDELVLSKSPELSRANPLEWILQATAQGIDELIVLDLTRVGTMRGISEDDPWCPFFQEIRNELPDVHLTSGGGVRCAEDAAQLLRSGCDHVLVASAIHQCRFTHDDIEALMTLS
jgi:phosphoribosylformimino-5-aminoimidazole carboxamide ribotide isomerase